LIYDKCVEKADGFENALQHFPSGFNMKQVQPELSGNYNWVIHRVILSQVLIELL
jgi:hypothetical protein